jgi:hypothetical protein
LQTRISAATEQGFPTPQAPVYDNSHTIDEDETFLEFLWNKAIEVAEDAGLSSIDRLMRDHIQFFEKLGFKRSELENKDLVNVIFQSGDPFNGRPSFLLKEFDSGIPTEIYDLYNKLTPTFRDKVGRYLYPGSGVNSLSPDEKLILSLFTYNYFLRIENRIDMANLYQLFIDGRYVLVEDYGLTLRKNGDNIFKGNVPTEADVGSHIPNSIINKNIGKYQDADKITVHPFNVESVENLANNRSGSIPQRLTDQELSHIPVVNVVRINGEQVFLITDLESARTFKLREFNGEHEITIGFTHKLEWSDAQNRYIVVQLNELELNSVGTAVHRIKTLDDLIELKQAIDIYSNRMAGGRVTEKVLGKDLESVKELNDQIEDIIKQIRESRNINEQTNAKLINKELDDILEILNSQNMNHLLANGFRKNSYNAIARGDASMLSSYRVTADGGYYKSPAANSLIDINTGNAKLIADTQHLDQAFGPGHYQGGITIVTPTRSSFDPKNKNDIIAIIDNFKVKSSMPGDVNKLIEDLNLALRESYTGKNSIIHNSISIHRANAANSNSASNTVTLTDRSGKTISVDGKPIEFRYLTTTTSSDASIADILKLIREMNKGSVKNLHAFLQLKEVMSKEIMSTPKTVTKLEQVLGRPYLAILSDVIHSDGHYPYLKQLLEDGGILTRLKSAFDGGDYEVRKGDLEVINKVVQIFIERRVGGISTHDLKIINGNAKYKHNDLMLREIRDDFSYILPETRVPSNAFDDTLYAVDGFIPVADEELILIKVQNFATANFFAKQSDGSYALKVNTNFFDTNSGKYTPRSIQELVDEAMDPYRPRDASGNIIPDKLPTGRQLTGARTAEASVYSTIRNLYILGAYLEVGNIAKYYDDRLHISILNKINSVRISTEFKDMKHVTDEDLLWRIFISDVIGIDRSTLMKYGDVPHPSAFDTDYAKNLATIQFSPKYKYNDIGNYDVRAIFDRNFRIKDYRDPGGHTFQVIDSNGNRVGLAHESHNQMTIADLGLQKPQQASQTVRIVPKESTIFFDRMYYANLLETRLVTEAQYREFVTAWAEVIAITTKKGTDNKQLKYLFAILNDIDSGSRITIDTASNLVKTKDEFGNAVTFKDNIQIAEYLAKRFAPPTMYRDHVSGKWVKASPETQLYRQSHTDGSNNKPLFWLFRIYQDGPVRIYVDSTPEGRIFKSTVEDMIKMYDDILNGDFKVLFNLKAHFIYAKFGETGMGLIMGTNSAAKTIDDYIRKLI